MFFIIRFLFGFLNEIDMKIEINVSVDDLCESFFGS